MEASDLEQSHIKSLKKSQKLINVVYKVTELNTKDNPTSKELNNLTFEVMKDILEGRRNEGALERARETVYRLLEVLSVAQEIGLVSSMNGRIIEEEYVALTRRLTWRQGSQSQLGEGVTHERLNKLFGSQAWELASYIRHEDTRDVQGTRERPLSSDRKYVPEDRRHFGDEQSERYAHERTVSERPKEQSLKHNDRRAAIFGILQQKPRITVKDVTDVIKDVSEKTIQRELLAMVQQGVLKKEGERRWSSYSLISN